MSNSKIERIQNLLSVIADDGATEGEKINASKLVSKLMRKYSLSDEEIKNYTKEKFNQLNFEEFNYDLPKFSTVLSLQRLFIYELGLQNFVKTTYYSGKGNQTVILFGTNKDIQLVIYAFESIHNQIIEGCEINYNQIEYKINKGKFNRSFYYGAMESVIKNIKNAMEENDKCENTTSIVLAKDTKLNDEFNKLHPSLHSSKINIIINNAYSSGMNYGNNISTGKGITGNLRLT